MRGLFIAMCLVMMGGCMGGPYGDKTDAAVVCIQPDAVVCSELPNPCTKAGISLSGGVGWLEEASDATEIADAIDELIERAASFDACLGE